MKQFLSIQKFKELQVLFYLEVVIASLLALLISINNFHPDYWDARAFSISFGIWILSSLLESERIFNLATLLAVGSFSYLIFWFVFNLLPL